MKALLVSALLVVAGGGPRAALAGPDDIDPVCLSMAQAYFAALQNGDRQALLSLFAGRSLHRNKAQLADPAYSRFLVDRYAGARFEVTNGGMISGTQFIDIAIWINGGKESVKERLFFRPSGNLPTGPMRIVARKELLN